MSGVRYRVTHTTSYRYESGATLCTNMGHLLPRETANQRVLDAEVAIDPTPDTRQEHLDTFGNRVLHFAVERPHEHLEVCATSHLEVGLDDAAPPGDITWEAATHNADAEDVLLSSATPLVPDLREVAAYAAPSFEAGRPLLEAVTELTTRIRDELSYDPTATTVSTPLAEVVQRRAGVCQDFAHLEIGCLRSVSLTARYVSGYLETFPPPGQPKLVGADASHAWCAVRFPDGSWLDLDPTNALVAPPTHLTVAWGRDYADVVPLRGIVQSTGGATTLDVAVDVRRLSG